MREDAILQSPLDYTECALSNAIRVNILLSKLLTSKKIGQEVSPAPRYASPPIGNDGSKSRFAKHYNPIRIRPFRVISHQT